MDDDEAHVAEACNAGGLDATEKEQFVVQKCGSAGLDAAVETALSQINDDAIRNELDEMMKENEEASSDGEDDEASHDEVSNADEDMMAK